VRDHIFSEAIGKQNDILGKCMYCLDPFGSEDKWKLDHEWFTTYISVTCSSCSKEHRFKDPNIHTLDDLMEKLGKKS
jgi:RNase P subunit RPR2